MPQIFGIKLIELKFTVYLLHSPYKRTLQNDTVTLDLYFGAGVATAAFFSGGPPVLLL
jgi:hypothetical protein